MFAFAVGNWQCADYAQKSMSVGEHSLIGDRNPMVYLEDHAFQHISISYATNVSLAVGLLD